MCRLRPQSRIAITLLLLGYFLHRDDNSTYCIGDFGVIVEKCAWDIQTMERDRVNGTDEQHTYFVPIERSVPQSIGSRMNGNKITAFVEITLKRVFS